MGDDSKRLVLMDLKYETLESIGKGAFGTVIKVRDRTTLKESIAKIINTNEMTEKQQALALNESKVLAELEHPHIIKYEECYSDSVTFYIVMEYARHGDLWQLLQDQKAKATPPEPFPEDTVMRWFVQMASALFYLHSCSVLHRDMKSKNVLLAAPFDNLKVADFGLSRILDTESKIMTVCGTPHYMAPEVLTNSPYNAKCDAWALGCVLYECAALEHAFRGYGVGGAAQINSLMQKVVNAQYKPVQGFSEDLTILISSLICSDAKKRLSCRKALLVPFVNAHFMRYLDGIQDQEVKEYFDDTLQQLQEESDDD